jgi:hypothetical protein
MNFSQQILRYVDERVQLYDSWGPDNSGLVRAYFDAAQIAIANGDLARGHVFAERAVGGWRTTHGSDSEEVINYAPLAQNSAKYPLCGISKNWSTPLGEVPPQSDSNDFEDWLWRREQPKKVGRSEQPTRVERLEQPKGVERPAQPKIFEQLGKFTNLRNREIFPAFTSLPLRSGLVEATPASFHWCFLGEIVGSMTLHHLELKLTDVDNYSLPLHFNTDGLGTEVVIEQIRQGYTVAVLYARRQTFMHGDPGIKLVDPKMLKVRISQSHDLLQGVLTYSGITKIFSVSLNELLELSDRIQQSSGKDGTKTCHGCGKTATLPNRCGRCSLFWYCDNVRPRSTLLTSKETDILCQNCQKTGWNERGHKGDCKLLKDPELRGLFVREWDEVDTRMQFHLLT